MPINGPRFQESCPLRGHWASFRLVDEWGNGEPYSGLKFTIYDIQGQSYTGATDSTGYAKVENFYHGPAFLEINTPFETGEKWYEDLRDREKFPIPLTALQVAAEQTPAAHRKPDAPHLPQLRAREENAEYLHVQVRDFVHPSAAAHLPEIKITRHFPSPFRVEEFKAVFAQRGEDKHPGVPLEPCRHHVLEVMALRAYSPILSRSKAFCALNCYHLAVMSSFVYAPFNTGRKWDERPTPPPYLGEDIGSIGRVLHHQLPRLNKATLFNNAGPYHLFYEEVPYSKRLEVVPWDTIRYSKEKEEGWEYPEDVHYLHNKADTQAFMTHNDKVILISIRGTQETADILRDADARQVPHVDGLGQAHRGFHEAFVSTKRFIEKYLESFHTNGQTVLVVGHSLGGAIALLVAEWIRRSEKKPDVVLYTYGAPRVGDKTFVREAKDLVHHRIVNHNDPVPGVPATWMDVELKTFVPAAAIELASPLPNPLSVGVMLASLINMEGDNYQHHGEQRHFMPREPDLGASSSVLWQPGCESLERYACIRYGAAISLDGDMPERASFINRLKAAADHSSHTGYSRAALATLIRWYASVVSNEGRLFIPREIRALSEQVEELESEIARWQHRSLSERLFVSRAFASKSPLFAGKTDPQLARIFRDSEGKLNARAKQEIMELQRARTRLRAASERSISLADVVGDQAGREDLHFLFNEWLRLPEVAKATRLVLLVAK